MHSVLRQTRKIRQDVEDKEKLATYEKQNVILTTSLSSSNSE